jgi:predicted signal transduction protein with EAL and GGDEF domain
LRLHRADPALHAAAGDYLALDLSPDDPDPEPGLARAWRGAAAIAVAGVATIVLLGAVVVQSGYRATPSIWIWLGLPIVLLTAAAARLTAARQNRVAVQRETASSKRASTSRFD